MKPLPQPLYDEVQRALAESGRSDLANRLLPLRARKMLTSGQAAALLGVSSANTVKNWLEAGLFPGAYKTAGGHWRFDPEEVAAVKARADALREKNRRGDRTPPEAEDEALATPPLL